MPGLDGTFWKKKADQKPICGVKVWNIWVCTQNVQVQMWGGGADHSDLILAFLDDH